MAEFLYLPLRIAASSLAIKAPRLLCILTRCVHAKLECREAYETVPSFQKPYALFSIQKESKSPLTDETRDTLLIESHQAE